VKVPEKDQRLSKNLALKNRRYLPSTMKGLISRDERRRMIVEIWHRAKTRLEKLLPETLNHNGSAFEMWKSGARGSLGQIAQMAGMKGLIVNTRGETLEFPILSSMKEGMTPN
jgi:DNA-directed RNA polymerase subunit beta'